MEISGVAISIWLLLVLDESLTVLLVFVDNSEIALCVIVLSEINDDDDDDDHRIVSWTMKIC